MKVKLFWKSDCGPCERFKKELSKLPKKYKKPVQIENLNISTEDREELEVFPTLVFYSDNNRVLRVISGFHPIADIINAYEKVSNLEYLQEKYKNLNERNAE